MHIKKITGEAMLKKVLFFVLIIPVATHAEELTGKKTPVNYDATQSGTNFNRDGAAIKRQLDITPENSYNVYQLARHNILVDNGPAQRASQKMQERTSIPDAPEEEPQEQEEQENKQNNGPIMPAKNSYKSYMAMKMGLKMY